MSGEVTMDRSNMTRRMDDVVERADAVNDALRAIPAPADGGTASALLSLIAAAGAEAANEYAGSVEVIGAVTDRIMADTAATEESIAAELQSVERELGG